MPRITPDSIRQILDKTDLVELIAQYISLKKQGVNYVACCPFHQEKSPSFSISPQKQMYYCFGCGASGDAITFLREQERLDYPEAVSQLAQKAGLDVIYENNIMPRINYNTSNISNISNIAKRFPEDMIDVLPAHINLHLIAPSPSIYSIPATTDNDLAEFNSSHIDDVYDHHDDSHINSNIETSNFRGDFKTDFKILNKEEKKQSLQLLQNLKKFYVQELKKSEMAIEYIHKRGINSQTARQFYLGWAGAFDSLKPYTKADEQKILTELGIFAQNPEKTTHIYERFRQRIMFPIHNTQGDVVGFGGRVLDERKPKYLNSPQSALFNKSETLYGLYENKEGIKQSRKIIVVEGYMDVVMLYQHGVNYAVATLGTACTEQHIRTMLRFSDEIIFAFDGDRAGKQAAERVLERILPTLKDQAQFKFFFLPHEHDPDSYIKNIGQLRFEEELNHQSIGLSQYLIQFLTQGMSEFNAEDKAKILKNTQYYLKLMPPIFFKKTFEQALLKKIDYQTPLLSTENHNDANAYSAYVSGAKQPNSQSTSAYHYRRPPHFLNKDFSQHISYEDYHIHQLYHELRDKGQIDSKNLNQVANALTDLTIMTQNTQNQKPQKKILSDQQGYFYYLAYQYLSHHKDLFKILLNKITPVQHNYIAKGLALIFSGSTENTTQLDLSIWQNLYHDLINFSALEFLTKYAAQDFDIYANLMADMDLNIPPDAYQLDLFNLPQKTSNQKRIEIPEMILALAQVLVQFTIGGIEVDIKSTISSLEKLAQEQNQQDSAFKEDWLIDDINLKSLTPNPNIKIDLQTSFKELQKDLLYYKKYKKNI